MPRRLNILAASPGEALLGRPPRRLSFQHFLRSLKLQKFWFTRIRIVGAVQVGCNAGFAVTVEEIADLEVVRNRLGVPADLAACHTAEIAGYVIEGHVPALAVQRLLEKRPIAVGLAVPGMPAGSPGMEGGALQKYEVVLFGAASRQTFMTFVGTRSAS